MNAITGSMGSIMDGPSLNGPQNSLSRVPVELSFGLTPTNNLVLIFKTGEGQDFKSHLLELDERAQLGLIQTIVGARLSILSNKN